MVVDTLLSSGHKSDGAIVYYYCNRNKPDRRDPTTIMQAFIKQFSLQSSNDGLPKPVVAEYKKRNQEGHAAGSLGFQECQA